MTPPSKVLKARHVDSGSQGQIAVTADGVPELPITMRRRYSLRALLQGATPETMRQTNDATAWALEGPSVGREL